MQLNYVSCCANHHDFDQKHYKKFNDGFWNELFTMSIPWWHQNTHVVIFVINTVGIICPRLCWITLWMRKPAVFRANFWSISFRVESHHIWTWLIYGCIYFCDSPTQKSLRMEFLWMSTKNLNFVFFAYCQSLWGNIGSNSWLCFAVKWIE